jgi:hypothetical protein
MVRNGLALDWPKYSNGDYAAAQREAKRAEMTAAPSRGLGSMGDRRVF